MAPIDPQTVVAIVAIINALAAAAALLITTFFAARRAGRGSAIDDEIKSQMLGASSSRHARQESHGRPPDSTVTPP